MADPKTDGCDVCEAKKAFDGLIVTCGTTSGVFQLVEAPFDKVAQCINRVVYTDTHLA